MGSKNYLFNKNDRGAEDNAVFYSLLESCNIVGVKPLEWLPHVLGRLRTDSTEDEITALLPYNYKKSQEYPPGIFLLTSAPHDGGKSYCADIQ